MSFLSDASLVMIPSGYKDGKLYSQKPTDGDGDFTFSRGSNLAATRVNSDGLIEKGRTNFLLQSNAITTSPWNIARILSRTSGQEGYDGNDNAWLVVPSNVSDTHSIFQSVTGVNGVTTISVYAKSGGYNYFAIRDDSSGSSYARFDLSLGVTSITGTNAITSKIKDVGNGWYRCSLTYTETATGNIIFYVNNAYDFASVYTGDEVSGVYFQDFQIEQGLVATDYIETGASTAQAGILEDMPRLDYSGGATCPSLLLEPQRTNLYTYSEYSAIWNKTNWTTTDNYAISPEGVKNAFRAVSLNTSGILYLSGSGTTGQDNTLSVWAKSNTGGEQKFRFWGNGNTITSSDFTATTEWQRFDYTYNCAFVTAGIKGASSELSDILFYGFQHEAGSYPTSYIPTYGASVTRGADATQQLDVSGFISGNSYTLLLNADLNDSDNNFVFMELLKTTGAGSFTFRNFNGLLRVYNQADGNYPVGSISSESNKWVVRVDGTSYDIFSLNSGVPTKRSGTALTTQREIGKVQFDGVTKYDLDQLLIFQTALTDAECKSLVQ